GQLLKKGVIERLGVNQRVARKSKAERTTALRNERETLMADLRRTADAYAAIDVTEIAHLEAAQADLVRRQAEASKVLADQGLSALVHDFAVVATYVRSIDALALILKHQGQSPKRLNEIGRIAAALGSCSVDTSVVTSALTFSLDRLGTLKAA